MTLKESVEDIITTIMATQTEKDLEPEDRDYFRILAIKVKLANTIN